jgi:hypothetical protein
MSKTPPRKFKNHAWQDRADKAYAIKAQKKLAAANKKRREELALESAKKAFEADVAVSLVESTDEGDPRMLVTKIVNGKP